MKSLLYKSLLQNVCDAILVLMTHFSTMCKNSQ
jgi:hypothetical protein